MSISDELMWNYYELATEVPIEEIKSIREGVKDGSYHPMEAKKKLASEIVALYHGKEEGIKAREYFETIFSKREIAADIKEVRTGKEEIGIMEILCQLLGVCKSNGEARRLILGNGVKINGETVTDANLIVKVEDGMILKAGKKTIVKLLK